MIPAHIIEKAQEGGWESTEVPMRSMTEAHCLAVLDPLFWQALEKQNGGKWEVYVERGTLFMDWNEIAHRFYHLILTGSDTEKFWEEIKQKP